MASTSAAVLRVSHVRPKHVVFGVLGAMFLFVLWHDERFIFDHSDPSWAYYFAVRWFIIPHGLAGLTALLLGPFQLSVRFRERHRRAHRIMGRVYLSAVLVAGCMGMYLAYIHQELQDRIWVFALATSWLLTGSMAFAAALNRNFDTHRRWMIRNYALTTAFVTTRIAIAIPLVERGGDALLRSANWVVLVGTLLFAEVFISWREVFLNRREKGDGPFSGLL